MLTAPVLCQNQRATAPSVFRVHFRSRFSRVLAVSSRHSLFCPWPFPAADQCRRSYSPVWAAAYRWVKPATGNSCCYIKPLCLLGQQCYPTVFLSRGQCLRTPRSSCFTPLLLLMVLLPCCSPAASDLPLQPPAPQEKNRGYLG